MLLTVSFVSEILLFRNLYIPRNVFRVQEKCALKHFSKLQLYKSNYIVPFENALLTRLGLTSLEERSLRDMLILAFKFLPEQ